MKRQKDCEALSRRYRALRAEIDKIIKKIRLVATTRPPEGERNPGLDAIMLLLALELDKSLGRKPTRTQIEAIEGLVADAVAIAAPKSTAIAIEAKLAFPKSAKKRKQR